MARVFLEPIPITRNFYLLMIQCLAISISGALLFLVFEGQSWRPVWPQKGEGFTLKAHASLTIHNVNTHPLAMLQPLTKRKIRHFTVYKQGKLALMIDDRPGHLHSTATPSPQGPPSHPFLDGTAFYALYEHEMGALLRQSTSFDQFVTLLIEAGYDIVSIEGAPPLEGFEQGFRIEDAQGVAGVVWHRGGQFTSVSWQPMPDQLVFGHATLTSYRDQTTEEFLQLLHTTQSFQELLQGLESRNFRLVELKSSHSAD